MIKYIFSIIIFITLFFFSCKKKDNPPPVVANTTTGGSTSGLTPSTGGDYSNLQTTYRFTNVAGVVTKDSSIFASFYSAPVTSVMPIYIYAGLVSLNGTNIPYQNSFYYIISNPSVNIAGPLVWNVTGSGTLAAYTHSFTPFYPKYTGGNSLPDTCIKANGITINISGVTNNLNSVIISIYSGPSTLTKYILGSTGSVNFTSAELANFTVNSSLTIIINLSNLYSATYNGIKHGFTNNIQYTKYSYLK